MVILPAANITVNNCPIMCIPVMLHVLSFIENRQQRRSVGLVDSLCRWRFTWLGAA